VGAFPPNCGNIFLNLVIGDVCPYSHFACSAPATLCASARCLSCGGYTATRTLSYTLTAYDHSTFGEKCGATRKFGFPLLRSGNIREREAEREQLRASDVTMNERQDQRSYLINLQLASRSAEISMSMHGVEGVESNQFLGLAT